MAIKVDIIAPQLQAETSAVTLARWLKGIGDPVVQNEPVAELFGTQMRAYALAPATGTLSSMDIQPGQNVLSGTVLGQLAVINKDAIDWDNFDQVTEILEDYANKSKDFSDLRDANEALGQLLGIADKPVFQSMDTEKQNQFLQNIVDQHKQNGLSPALVAQKLLEGLALRMPKITHAMPTGPAFGFGGPAGMSPMGPGGAGGGMGGGGFRAPQPMIPQQDAYPAYPVYPAGGYPGVPTDGGQWLPPSTPAHGYPTAYPAQNVPPVVIPPIKDVEEDKKD